MKHTQDEKLAYLADEIGRVEDRFLAETMSYRSARTLSWKLPTAIAASILALVVSGSLIFGSLRPNTSDTPTQAPPTSDIGNAPTPPPVTLDGILSEGAKTPFGIIQSADAIHYFEGVYLVWQTADSDTLYRSRDLTDSETKRLFSLIDKGAHVGSESPSQVCRVWLLRGDGTVLTPYLPNTAGNMGSSVLFDYEAELHPSKELISCISDILNIQKGR